MSSSWRRLRWHVLFLVIAGIFVLAVWARRQEKPVVESAVEAVADADPRLTFPTPYRNVRPETKYVGDEACAGCHAGIAATFRRHPMGRSMAPISQIINQEDYSAATRNPYEKFGLQFSVERRDAQVLHSLFLLDEQGKELYRRQQAVNYVVGSGARGRAYLVEHDGRLYQSPTNWYSQARRWDLAPNTSSARQNDFFGPITPQCVFCHAGRAEPIETSSNRYQTPVFNGSPAIGCQRCHGPGELHVLAQTRGEPTSGADETIVNPRRLEPALRESVCQQCHLQGEVRVERRGRNTFDYRPGLPLEAFWSVFVRAPATRDQQTVGQVEQMIGSRCSAATPGGLGCISCHDPHALPEPDQRDAFYRTRCLACHQDRGCSMPVAERQVQNNSCIACHMTRLRPADVAHTAITDHRILRRPGRLSVPPPSKRPLLTEIALASFYGDGDQIPDRDLLRDLGVALVESRAPRRERQAMGQLALPLLEASLKAAPDDARALLAKGEALRLSGRPAEALAAFQDLLRLAPDYENALQDAARVSDSLGQSEAALDYWQQALALAPGSPDCHLGLAKVWAAKQSWRQGAQECQAVLRLAPEHLEARMILVQCALQSGDRDLARREITILLATDTPQKEPLRRLLLQLSQPPPQTEK
jgi:tetratricopeptide (TPR) repeat protein